MSQKTTPHAATPSDDLDQPDRAASDLPEPDVDLQVEIFRTRNRMLAQMVCDEILAGDGISAVIHDRQMHSLPAPLTMSGEVAVAVSEIDRELALSALREAAQNGVPLDDGEIVEESVG